MDNGHTNLHKRKRNASPFAWEALALPKISNTGKLDKLPLEICALLVYYAACGGNSLPKFRDISVPSSRIVFDFSTPEDGTDSWSQNVGKELPPHASHYPTRAQISSISRRKLEVTQAATPLSHCGTAERSRYTDSLRVGRFGVQILVGTRDFLFTTSVQTGLGANKASGTIGTGALSRG
jgi:hypothetical protein